MSYLFKISTYTRLFKLFFNIRSDQIFEIFFFTLFTHYINALLKTIKND